MEDKETFKYSLEKHGEARDRTFDLNTTCKTTVQDYCTILPNVLHIFWTAKFRACGQYAQHKMINLLILVYLLNVWKKIIFTKTEKENEACAFKT